MLWPLDDNELFWPNRFEFKFYYYNEIAINTIIYNYKIECLFTAEPNCVPAQLESRRVVCDILYNVRISMCETRVIHIQFLSSDSMRW